MQKAQVIDQKTTTMPSLSESRVSWPISASSNIQPQTAPLVGMRLQSLVQSIDPTFVLDRACEQQILTLVDDFMDKTLQLSLKIAQHRGSKALEAEDLQLVLHKHWGITIPGLGPPLNKRPMTGLPPPVEPNKKRKSTSMPAGGPAKLQKDGPGQSIMPGGNPAHGMPEN
jgi:Transcription initiation factor TFIID subunit A